MATYTPEVKARAETAKLEAHRLWNESAAAIAALCPDLEDLDDLSPLGDSGDPLFDAVADWRTAIRALMGASIDLDDVIKSE